MKKNKTYKLAIFILLLSSQVSFAQTSLNLHADSYLSHRYGRSYGIGVKQQFSNNVFGLGITLNNLSCFTSDFIFIGLGCISSDGVGIKFTAHRFIKNKKLSDRLFYGFRTDIQLLEDVAVAPFALPIETNTTTFIILAELGYSIPLPKGFMIQGIISGGYSGHPLSPYPVLSMFSINLSKKNYY